MNSHELSAGTPTPGCEVTSPMPNGSLKGAVRVALFWRRLHYGSARNVRPVYTRAVHADAERTVLRRSDRGGGSAAQRHLHHVAEADFVVRPVDALLIDGDAKGIPKPRNQ